MGWLNYHLISCLLFDSTGAATRGIGLLLNSHFQPRGLNAGSQSSLVPFEVQSALRQRLPLPIFYHMDDDVMNFGPEIDHQETLQLRGHLHHVGRADGLTSLSEGIRRQVREGDLEDVTKVLADVGIAIGPGDALARARCYGPPAGQQTSTRTTRGFQVLLQYTRRPRTCR